MIENPKKSKKVEFIIKEEMKNINLSNESLKPLAPNTDFISLMQKLKEILNNKNSDWTLQISAINYFRTIFKYEKSIFTEYFYGAKFYLKFLELIDSVRSSLSKNVLTLFNEIFSEPILEEKFDINLFLTLIKDIIPHLITKINSNQSFIKKEANLCLESIVKNVKYIEVLFIFMQLINGKKGKDCDLCCKLSIKIIKNFGKEFFLQNNRFNEFMKYIVEVQNVKKAKEILNCFIDVISKNEFEKKLEGISKKEKDRVKNILEMKIVETRKRVSNTPNLQIREFINEKRKSLKTNKSHEIKEPKKILSVKIIPLKEKFELKNKILKENNENVDNY